MTRHQALDGTVATAFHAAIENVIRPADFPGPEDGGGVAEGAEVSLFDPQGCHIGSGTVKRMSGEGVYVDVDRGDAAAVGFVVALNAAGGEALLFVRQRHDLAAWTKGKTLADSAALVPEKGVA